jgi:hypothetical protein
VRDVACDRAATDLSRDRLSALRIPVAHDYGFGPSVREPSRESPADASGAARDDDNAISYFHSAPPLRPTQSDHRSCESSPRGFGAGRGVMLKRPQKKYLRN